ncbi:MAG: hypothetical protein JXA69_10130, partial [Phycisphaerae bacterium]|nr:hypothetical protein [Phycisphaerae bacterium]
MAAEVRLRQQAHDPYGYPRPGAGQTDVPLRTSFYFELGAGEKASADRVLPESVAVEMRAEGQDAVVILSPGQTFAPGYTGRLFPRQAGGGNVRLAIYIESETPLAPETTYELRVTARSDEGGELPPAKGTWTFTTETATARRALSFDLDMARPPIEWHGAFFSGFCKPSFCNSLANLVPTYERMDEVHQRWPKAWSLQRDFWLTGMEYKPEFLAGGLPGVVRERETRRIRAMSDHADGILLHVEDFFGHEQYGIASDSPVSADYHPGDEVLIADGAHDARAKVLVADDAARTVLVSAFAAPMEGWQIDYVAPLPEKEDPNAPGLWPPGGCFLRKFRPVGTPCYYWGRVHAEWDLAHRRFGRRLMPNFADAPGDLAIDGRNWTTAKDYAQLHEVVRVMTDHLIERYRDACLDFVWGVFNEPDLGGLFWRTDWDELQRFYDYTVDAILRAFEDRGYDSDRAFVGGLELGGIFGTHLRITEFLAHCSPRAEAKGALPLNAAFADGRLEGKRSKRVETLCRAHAGRGSPCDFVSVHAYNAAPMMAAKLARAKEIALELDPEYYKRLWVNSHEACPNWSPPP